MKNWVCDHASWLPSAAMAISRNLVFAWSHNSAQKRLNNAHMWIWFGSRCNCMAIPIERWYLSHSVTHAHNGSIDFFKRHSAAIRITVIPASKPAVSSSSTRFSPGTKIFPTNYLLQIKMHVARNIEFTVVQVFLSPSLREIMVHSSGYDITKVTCAHLWYQLWPRRYVVKHILLATSLAIVNRNRKGSGRSVRGAFTVLC